MLTQLSIKNFAIIDEISIEFNEGLTILTGETGAGKSIIIDAVNLLSGARSSVEYVRYGTKKAEITGLFHISPKNDKVFSVLKSLEIPIEEEMLIIERQINHKGKSTCKINGKLVTLSALKSIGELIITIHSQHDTLTLMDESNHLSLLDSFDSNILESKEKFKVEYEKLVDLKNKYKLLNSNEKEINQRIDLIQYQMNEIETAQLTNEEDDELNEERLQLQNYEKIHHNINKAYNIFHQEGQVYEKLNVLHDNLLSLENIDDTLTNISKDTSNAFYQFEDIMFRLRDYRDNLFFDEEKLNQIEARLLEINKLKKKYGETIEAIQIYYNEIKTEYESLINKDSQLDALRNDIIVQRNKTINVAEILSQLRTKAALKLRRTVQQELKSLYIKNAVFDVLVENRDTLNKNGLNEVKFLIATNKGEPLKALSKVASGGELSRVMLAMLKILIQSENIGTIIFDEIDTGVSGRVAQSIADKMHEISESTQVLGITHLPQVASIARTHLRISKHEVKERTTTEVKQLNKGEKIEEIAKMITGEEITGTAKKHASELINQSHFDHKTD